MKIFLLKLNRLAGPGETRGMVVVASDKVEARIFASTNSHSRNPDDESANGYGAEGPQIWRHDGESSCEEMGIAHSWQKVGVVLSDFVYG